MTIVSAVLAGGIINQLFISFFGDKIQYKRDFKKWRRIERYNIYSKMIDLTSSSNPDCGKEKWPSMVRALSQRIYLLHKNGRPPQDLCDSLEDIFQLVNKSKKMEIDDESLKPDLRTVGSLLRRRLAMSLEKDD